MTTPTSLNPLALSPLYLSLKAILAITDRDHYVWDAARAALVLADTPPAPPLPPSSMQDYVDFLLEASTLEHNRSRAEILSQAASIIQLNLINKGITTYPPPPFTILPEPPGPSNSDEAVPGYRDVGFPPRDPLPSDFPPPSGTKDPTP